jgi:hypothetical protein
VGFVPAATKDPTNQRALKREVMIGRSFGYASSPINDEPAMIQKGMPKPSRSRATTYMRATTDQQMMSAYNVKRTAD